MMRRRRGEVRIDGQALVVRVLVGSGVNGSLLGGEEAGVCVANGMCGCCCNVVDGDGYIWRCVGNAHGRTESM